MIKKVKFYIDPQDIFDKLSKEDKELYTDLYITDVSKQEDGTVEIGAIVCRDGLMEDSFRQKLEI